MKKITKKILVLLMGIFTMFSSSMQVFASGSLISLGKEATPLDENFQTKVTLSIPKYAQQVKRDIVLILDASDCNEFTQTSVQSLIQTIKEEIEGKNEEVKIGVVFFKGSAVHTGWTDIKDFDATKLPEKVEQYKASGELSGHGTNIPSGLLAAKELLESDTEVLDERKTVFFLSDGITYLFTKDNDYTTDYDISFGLTRGPEDGGGKFYTELATTNQEWEDLYNKVEKNVGYYVKDGTDTDYTFRYNTTTGFPKVLPSTPVTGSDYIPANVEVSLYQTIKYYKEISNKYPTYAVRVGVNETFKWGKTLMDYLAGYDASDYSLLEDKILTLIESDSYLYDEIGDGDNYNYDVVNNIKSFDVILDGQAMKKTQINNNRYGFGDPFVKDNEVHYPFELQYNEENIKENIKENLTWYINKPVQEYQTVKFTYYLQLEEYEKGINLYTNNDAKLYINNGNGNFTPHTFEKPFLTIPKDPEKPPVPTPTPEPDPDSLLPNTGMPIWPVPVCIVVGSIFVISGFKTKKKAHR